MPPDYTGNANRDMWRGATSERIKTQEQQVSKLWEWISGHEKDTEHVLHRLAVLETKLWAMCGLAGFGGTIAALLVAAAFKRMGV